MRNIKEVPNFVREHAKEIGLAALVVGAPMTVVGGSQITEPLVETYLADASSSSHINNVDENSAIIFISGITLAIGGIALYRHDMNDDDSMR